MDGFNSNQPPSQEERDSQNRVALLRLIRISFMVAFLTVAALSWLGFSPWATGEQSLARSPNARFVLFFSLGLGVVVFMVDYFTPKRKIATLVSIFVGLLCSMIATLAFSYIIDLLFKLYDVLNEELLYTIKALVGIALAYLSVATVLQTRDDFRFVLPYVEFAKQIRGVRPLLLDTSSLIDGRIVDVAATGFIQSPMVVPRFVVDELQTLSDSDDVFKRSKGRRGLDVVSRLQKAPRLDVSVDEQQVPGKATDQMLIELARKMPAIIVTGDVGLARIAEIQQVPVLNLNDLANALKQSLVPGETLMIRLVRRGEQATQAVGYLPDGTMVVAEDGSGKIGETVSMTVTSSLQTSAGRMIFAKLTEGGTPKPPPSSPPSPSPSSGPEPHAAETGPSGPQDEPGQGGGGGGSGGGGTTNKGPRGPGGGAMRGPSSRNPRR
jgi:uncharacterized protein YacL